MPRLWDGRSLALSLGFVLCVALPSVGEIIKYTNLAVVIAYLIAAFGLFLIARAYILPKVLPRLGEKQVIGAAIAVLAITIAVFAVIYPIANDPETFGGGSDNDDALDITARELMNGNYPYYVRTYLDNPAHPNARRHTPRPALRCLGIQRLSEPLLAGCPVHSGLVISPRPPLGIGHGPDDTGAERNRMALGGNGDRPSIQRHLCAGGDAMADESRRAAKRSRSHEDSVCPVLGDSPIFPGQLLLHPAHRVLNPGPSIRLESTPPSSMRPSRLAHLAAITLPFYLYDPEGFAPLHTVSKLDSLKPAWDLAPVFIPVATGIIALLLSLFLLFHRTDSRYLAALGSCALVQGIPHPLLRSLRLYWWWRAQPLFM